VGFLKSMLRRALINSGECTAFARDAASSSGNKT